MRKANLKIVADSELPFVRDYFGEAGKLILKPGRSLRRADLVDADLLLVRSVTPVDENLLQGTAVKFVGTVTTGVDHLDTAWLDQAGILWRSAAGYNALPVADYVLAVVAALQQARLLSPSFRLGVVGVGQVGGRVAERCQRLGFEVLLCDPPRAEQEKNFSSQPLQALKKVDLLSLHTPLLSSGKHPTHHLIDATFLQARAQSGVLLNTGRGAVVDFSALAAHAGSWRYCFDVWEGEPQIPLDSLQASWLATPHLAGYSLQSRYRGIDLIYNACRELQLLGAKPKRFSTPTPPSQRLSFHGAKLRWQDVVLAIFDPLRVTREMREIFLRNKELLKGPEKCAKLFDALRKRYIGDRIQRHEFGATTVADLQLEEQDRYALTQLGMTIEE